MYTLSQIAQIVGGSLHGSATIYVAELYTDTRKIQEKGNALFFAISTTKNDGNNYVKHAISAGAAAVVVSRKPLLGCNYILVPDTLIALQALCTYHRNRFNIPVVAITGSNGKTIVKEWLARILATQLVVCKNPKSYNSQIGVPLSVWQLNADHQVGVFEAGISECGEMSLLEKIIQPTLGVFTHLGDAHASNFTSEEEKLSEKLALFAHCSTIVLGDSQPAVLQKMNNKQNQLFVWGSSLSCQLHISRSPDGAFIFSYKGESEVVILPFADTASVENAFSAAATALVLGLPLGTIARILPTLLPVDMRLQQVKGQNNTQLILDYYTNDYQSVVMALDFLNQQKTKEKTVVLLSDILESNLSDQILYQNINKLLLANRVTSLITIGPRTKKQREVFTLSTTAYESTEEFLEEYPLHSITDTAVLLKGAREFAFERIANKLKVKIHQTKLEVNLTRLQHNINVIKGVTGKSTKLMAMVKALGYGSGGYQIAKVLEYNNIDYLGVAYTDEAIELRKSGITTPIMVLNPDLNDLSPYVEMGIEPVIHSFASLAKVERDFIRIHLEFDTGMHRLGFEETQLAEVIERVERSSMLSVASVFSHLATADNSAMDDFTRKQLASFARISQAVEYNLGYMVLKHIANTAGMERFDDARFDMVRGGIGFYGVSTLGSTSQLLPVSTFKSYISQIRTVKAGEGIGYGQYGSANLDRKIAVVAVGYADGYNRLFSQGVGSFLIHNLEAKVVGNVCMDMTMCDVSHINCDEGDEVLIFGDMPRVEILAKQIGTIPYEILTNVSERVNRVFYQE